jgi:adenylyltransferase/sulfurtransferase
MGGSPLVRSVKMRPPSIKCISCGPNKTIERLEEYDYEAFCSSAALPEKADGVERISVLVSYTSAALGC